MNNGKSNRILGMTSTQVIILSVLACLGLTLIGVLAKLIIYNTPIASPTNIPSTPTPQLNNQISGCNAVDVDAWIDQTLPRLSAIDSDMDYLNSYPPNSYEDYIPFAENARQRYNAQLSQRTPACIEGVQEIAVEELWLFWKGLEAATDGDMDGVKKYLSRLTEISSQVDQAIQKIELTSATAATPTYISPSIDSTTTQRIIFRDDFQNSSTTKENWSSAGGTWVIEDGVLSCIANGKYLANITLPEDFTFQLDIMGINVIDKIIIFRAIGDSTGYGIDFRTTPYNDIVLVKSSPVNVGQIIQTVPFDNNNNTWYTIKVDVEDNHIKVFVNNQPTIDFIDTSSPLTDGTVGIGAMLQPGFSLVYYDNIVVSHK